MLTKVQACYHTPFPPSDKLFSVLPMEIPHRELATDDESNLVLSSLARLLSDTLSAKQQIAAALTPVFGIRRGAQIARKIHSVRLCETLYSPRNSKMGKSNYRRIMTLWKGARKCAPTFPDSWGERRCLVGKFNMGAVTPSPIGWGYRRSNYAWMVCAR